MNRRIYLFRSTKELENGDYFSLTFTGGETFPGNAEEPPEQEYSESSYYLNGKRIEDSEIPLGITGRELELMEIHAEQLPLAEADYNEPCTDNFDDCEEPNEGYQTLAFE